MRQKYGSKKRARPIARSLLVLIAVILVFSRESPADAGFLKNGANVREGSRLKGLRPPAAGSRNRIRAPGEARTPSSATKSKQQHAWFWKQHAVASSAANPARWDAVIKTMEERHGRGVYLTPAAALEKIATDHGAEIRTAAQNSRISEALLLAVISVESRGHKKAVSPKGAQGLMQLIPATAKRFGVSDPFNASQNVRGGAAYLDWLLKEFGGDPLLALAGYNAGEGAVRKHKGIPPYAETRDYVVKVMDALTLARSMCAPAPVSPRMRCIWRSDLRS